MQTDNNVFKRFKRKNVMPKKARVWIFSLFLLSFFSAIAHAQLPDFTEMVKANGGAVVNISTTQKIAGGVEGAEMVPQFPEGSMPPELEELFRRFNEQQGGGGGFVPHEARSLGSGFIISQDGYILTNHHVVKDATEIVVKLNDRRELVAKLIGSDARTDVAVLKIEARDLPVVTIGSPDKLQVGEWVLAIGSPFGFEQSVTAGIVSAKGRSLPGGNYVPFIQTDVAINPGNSGGPLFNMDGKVVGINSQIYSRTGGFMGLSFAIPMDVAMNIVEQIKLKGRASHGWLGVQIQDVTRELAESFGMKKPQGALVAKVITGGPGEAAGVQIGDIITEFNGQLIDHSADLPPMVGVTPINNDATLKIIRQGEPRTLHFNVGLLPDEDSQIALAKSKKSPENQLGIAISDLTNEQRQMLQIPRHGVLVQDVGQGAARDAGIQRGDVILQIQNTIVRDLKDFDKMVKKLPTGVSIAVLIQRQGNPVFLALKLK
jgi:serine protease Do